MVTLINRGPAVQEHANRRLMSITGAVVSAFSALVATVIIFVPSSCSFVSSIQLLLLVFLFIAGLIAFFSGLPALLKRRRVDSQ